MTDTNEQKTETLAEETARLLKASHDREDALRVQLEQAKADRQKAEERHARELAAEPTQSRTERMILEVERELERCRKEPGQGRRGTWLGRTARALKDGTLQPPPGARLDPLTGAICVDKED